MKISNKMFNRFIHKIIKFFQRKIYIYFVFMLLLFIQTLFADFSWQLPAQDVFTLAGINAGGKIATSSSGKNVYLSWRFNSVDVYTLSSNDFGNSWSSALQLDPPAQVALGNRITTNSSGQNVYIIYRGDNATTFSRSTDFGQTWTTGSDLKTLANSPSTNLSIATNTTGVNVYALWKGPNNVEFSRSTDSGATWPAPGAVTVLSDAAVFSVFGTKIAISDSGEFVHALWAGRDASYLQAQTSSSSDFGVTWSSPVDLSVDDQNVFNFNFATDSSGTFVYAIWEKPILAASEVQFSRSIDSGVNWTALPGITLSDSGIIARHPNIETDSSGQYVYVVWGELTSPYPIKIRRSTDFGVTWDATITISTFLPTFPDIAVDDSGKNVYLIWNAFVITPVFADVQESSVSTDFGESFTSAIRVSSQTENSVSPRPAITTSDSGVYVYAAFDRAYGDVMQVLNGLNPLPPSPAINRFKIVTVRP